MDIAELVVSILGQCQDGQTAKCASGEALGFLCQFLKFPWCTVGKVRKIQADMIQPWDLNSAFLLLRAQHACVTLTNACK